MRIEMILTKNAVAFGQLITKLISRIKNVPGNFKSKQCPNKIGEKGFRITSKTKDQTIWYRFYY